MGGVAVGLVLCGIEIDPLIANLELGPHVKTEHIVVFSEVRNVDDPAYDASGQSRRTAQRGWRLARAWWLEEYAVEDHG